AALDRLLAGGFSRGKSNEVTVQLMDGKTPRRLVVVGLGNAAVFSAECLREAGAALAKAARRNGLRSVAIYLPPIPDDLPPVPNVKPAGERLSVGAEAFAEGLVVGSFEYREYYGTARNEGDKAKPGPI